jgi:hypothetical protein
MIALIMPGKQGVDHRRVIPLIPLWVMTIIVGLRAKFVIVT